MRKLVAAISVVAMLISTISAFGGCQWVRGDDGVRERVCTPDYYIVLTVEPDWHLYNNYDIVFQHLYLTGNGWIPDKWYVVPYGASTDGLPPDSLGTPFETCYVWNGAVPCIN